jgi:hypothetical protein
VIADLHELATRPGEKCGLAQILAFGLLACSAASGFEQPHDLATRDVVAEETRSGEGYRVADPVRADGFALHYTVESDRFGSFEATSTYMLPIRVQEVRALEALSHIERREAFADAVVESAKTPVHVVKDLAQDPRGTLEDAGQGAEKAAKKAAGWIGGDRRERADSEDSAFSEAIGRSRRKRKLAHALGVDVYSSNTQLQEELDRVAWASVSGGMSFGALMAALPIPPVLEVARQTTGFTAGLSDLLVTKSGGDLYRMNREILRGMGMPDTATEPFLDNPKASPRHKTFIVAALREMNGVAGLETIVSRGREVASEEEALLLQRVAELARGHHVNVSPLRKIVRVRDHILLVTDSGDLVVALPADLLLWTEATRDLAASMSQHADAETDVGERKIWVTGVFSERARDELTDGDFALEERASERLEVGSSNSADH